MSGEENYTITNDFLEEIRNQFKVWASFLNTGIGLLSFTLAIASLGTNIPWVNATLSVIVVVFIRQQGKHYFPEKVKELRERAKTDAKAKVLLKGLESEFLNFKTLVMGYPIFLVGFVSLMLVALSPLIIKLIPSLAFYFGA